MNVVFVLTDNMLAAGTVLPIEMWRAAEQTRVGNKQSGKRLNIVTVGAEQRAMDTQSGIDLMPSASIAEVNVADVVYLPALWRNPRPVLRENSALLPWLRARFEQACLLAAVGTGCCFLAEAGLLDGKSATTHWHYLDQFQAAYPRVLLKRDYFITQSGSIYCAASVNALADVTIYLIERFYGREVAAHVERNFSHEIRRPYDKYRYLDGDDLQHSDESIVEVQLWMKRHIGDRIPMSTIAKRFGISQRSLNRRFQRAIGLSPLDYFQQVRVEAAAELLHTTNLSVAEVSYRVGYQDQGHFNRVFQREMAVTPTEYRKTVRAKIFSGNS